MEKLNLAFVANLFNNFPALDEPEEGPVIEETREEKSKFKKKIVRQVLIFQTFFSVPELDEFVRCQSFRQLFVHGFD